MRLHEIENTSIDEYKVIPDPRFTMPDFSSGKQIGQIQGPKTGPLQVWKITIPHFLQYAAVDPKIGPTKPLSFLTFQIGTNLLVAKNAYTEPKFQQKGLTSELFMYVNKIEGHKILSDDNLTVAGEKLWKSIIKSPKFNTKIVYLPTSELFDISEINKVTTKDGTTVISPAYDTHYGIYNVQNPNGQKFFYLIEMKIGYKYYDYNDKRYYETFPPQEVIHQIVEGFGITQAYRHFTDGDP